MDDSVIRLDAYRRRKMSGDGSTAPSAWRRLVGGMIVGCLLAGIFYLGMMDPNGVPSPARELEGINHDALPRTPVMNDLSLLLLGAVLVGFGMWRLRMTDVKHGSETSNIRAFRRRSSRKKFFLSP